MLKYLFQAAELADMSALDKVQAQDLVPVRIGDMQKGPISASALPVDSPILIFAAPAGHRRNTLLRFNLERDDAGAFLSLAEDPGMAVSSQAFFDADGQPRGDYSQEDVQERFLAAWESDAISSWDAFMQGLDQRCIDLTGASLLNLPMSLKGNFAGNLQAYLVNPEKLQACDMSARLKELLTTQRKSELFDHVLAPPGPMAQVRLTTARRDLFLGHMDERSPGGRTGHPLDPTQRLGAMTALAMDQNTQALPLLAVNGPPGTGKTSCLRASRYARCAKRWSLTWRWLSRHGRR